MANNTPHSQASSAADVEDGAQSGRRQAKEDELQAWLNVLGSFMVYFCSFGVINAYGFFQGYYQSTYLTNYAPSEIAFIGTMQLALLYLTSPVIGSLFDSYGIKYLYPAGCLACSGSLVALSFTQPNRIWQQFLTQGLVFGLAVGCGVQPALTIIIRQFDRRRALAMGLVAAGSSAGGTCIPIMLAKLIETIGFAWSVRICALITLACYAVALCLTRAGPPSRQLKSVGDLFDYGGFKDMRYVCLAAGSAVVNLGLYVPYYYAEPYCAKLDPQNSLNSYILPFINISSLVGRVIGGHFADVLGRLNLLYPMTTCAGLLCYVVWLQASTVNVVITFACLYGFCSGIFISVMPAATSQIIPQDRLGGQLGAVSSLTAISVFAGSPIAGALIAGDTAASYRPLIVYAGSTLVGGGMLLFAGRLLHGKDLRAKW